MIADQRQGHLGKGPTPIGSASECIPTSNAAPDANEYSSRLRGIEVVQWDGRPFDEGCQGGLSISTK